MNKFAINKYDMRVYDQVKVMPPSSTDGYGIEVAPNMEWTYQTTTFTHNVVIS